MTRYCVSCGFDHIGRYCGRCGQPQPNGGADRRPDVWNERMMTLFEQSVALPHEHCLDVDYAAVLKQVENHIEAGTAEGDVVLFTGTTWPGCICSPLCCRSVHWRLTTQRIDWEHGCCRANSDTLDFRRIKDVAYRANPMQVCTGRGTIHIWADKDGATSHVTLTCRKGKALYKQIRRVWTNSHTGVN